MGQSSLSSRRDDGKQQRRRLMRGVVEAVTALVVVSSLVTTALSCASPPAAPPQQSQAVRPVPAQYDTNAIDVVLPTGEAQAGRQAFLDLKCVVCHRVAGETTFPAPVSGTQGPDLDHTLGQRSPSEVAAAIIVPSHSMSVKTSDEVKKRLEGMLLSPMPDFSRAMTVRQLADLLAYLTSIEKEK
jgi:mono/diheme cytochrome c family protein